MNRPRRSASSRRIPAAADTEVELKLRLPQQRLREALALPLLRSAHGSATRKLAATYFDTPTLELSQRRIALRVRREGRRWVQAVKGGGSTLSGVHQRLEIENVLRNAQPDLSVLPRHAVTRILRSRKVRESLLPVMHTEITRTVRLIEPAPGVQIEVAIDRGVIRSGRRRERVCEIELELKSGALSALFDLAQQLLQVLPVALEHRSKAERGYDLFRGQAAPPAKAVPVILDPGMNAGQSFLAITATALAQIQANERGVLDSPDPEYLHQMRVGIRRLRSAFRLFRDQLGDAAAPQTEALRNLGAVLGPVRDWDVFVTETLPAVRPVLAAHVAAETFDQWCQTSRRGTRAALKKSIKTTNYVDFMIEMGRWLAVFRDHDEARWQQPATACATRILAACHARVLKRGRRLDRRSAAELHRLRIAIKQLRYAVGFFSSLYSARGMAAMHDRLALLQDILGRINDAATVRQLLVAPTAENREVIAAAGIVIGWCEAHAEAERGALLPAWRRFRAVRPPWRE